MRISLPVAALALFVALELHAACGVERWSVKTGTDSMASQVNLSSYVSSTIYNFHQSTKPASLPSNSRIAPRETTQYQLSGTLIKYNRQTDSDYHLVIKDGAGRTMIVELPATSCVGAGSPFATGIARARSQFDARFTATTTMKTTSTPVTIRGVGFWDFIHGQTGIAPNGIEIHPVLNITFGTSATSPSVLSEEEVAVDERDPANAAPERVWPADFVTDDDGGRVHLYLGGTLDMTAILHHGGSVLEDPSIRVLFADRTHAPERRAVLADAARIDRDEHVRDLDRYGVRTFGFRVGAQPIAIPEGAVNDLDVQRALLAEVESGRIQHVDPNVVYVVVLDAATNPNVGGHTGWLSYHSQFHPTELPMRYVVVRGGLAREEQQQAIRASIARAVVNPAGDGWY